METEDNPEIAEFLDDLKELGIGDLESPGVKCRHRQVIFRHTHGEWAEF